VEEEMSKSGKGTSKCYDCGGAKVTATVGPYRMKLAGEWHATIEDAVITHCGDCGGTGVGLENLDGIMRAIAAAVIRKPSRLAADEIRFLRTHLGWTGIKLAKMLGVGAGTVSRWENGKEPIGPVPDRLLRTLDVIREGAAGFDVDTLANIGDAAGAPLKLRVRKSGGKWKAAA
jgi:putative zinc finger/helix-turn-helix YgiT family protein